MTEPHPELEVEIFRGGDYGSKGRYDPPDLDGIAEDYRPERHEAPVTLDHAQQGPAHGWVKRLHRIGDRLVATLWKLSPALREWLRDGAYRKCSVELYRAFRETGRPYLKAVSFLGAAAPEVKGLQPPVFSETPPSPPSPPSPPLLPEAAKLAESAEPAESDGADDVASAAETVVCLSEPPFAPAPASAPADPPPSFPSVSSVPSAAALDVIARLKQSGRWAPAWERAGLAGFLEHLAAHAAAHPAAAISFRRGDEETALPPLAWFLEFLAQLPPPVPFGEWAAESDLEAAHGAAALPGVPRSTPRAALCPRSLDLHRRAVRFMNEHPQTAYAEALRAVARE